MRRRAIALLAAAALLGAGCGDDDDGGDGDGGGGGGDAGGAGPGAPTKEALASCLEGANLELKPGSEPFTDPKGQKRTRKGLDIEDTAYLGYVQWPSKHIADIYLSTSEDAAEDAEGEAAGFVTAFGLDPDKYVQRSGTVVMLFDDPAPTGDESKTVEDCAAGG